MEGYKTPPQPTRARNSAGCEQCHMKNVLHTSTHVDHAYQKSLQSVKQVIVLVHVICFNNFLTSTNRLTDQLTDQPTSDPWLQGYTKMNLLVIQESKYLSKTPNYPHYKQDLSFRLNVLDPKVIKSWFYHFII